MLIRRLKKGDKLRLGGQGLPEVRLVVKTNPDMSLSLEIDAPREVAVTHEKATKGLDIAK